MGTVIDGRAVAAKVRSGIKEEVSEFVKSGITPGLAVVIVGNNQASRAYVNNKEKACEEVGIRSEEYALPEETTEEELLELVKKLNEKEDVDGILVQMPLPKQINEEKNIKCNRSHKGRRCIPSRKRRQNYDRKLRFSSLHPRRRYGAH